MHDFINTILRYFSKALAPALLAALLAGGALFLYYVWRKDRGCPIPVRRAAAIALLACYLAGLVTITLLIRTANPGMRLWVQTHLFLAFWEAWNAFTLQIWLNPLLNIAMFIPFGVLLPLALPRFQRWYWTLAAGLSTSLAIEIIQYFTGRGQADVDDLFCNTLGAALGFCLCLAALSLSRREWKAAGLYTILPALSAAVLAGIFLVYQLQPYGNLADGPIPAAPADTSGTRWVLDCPLSDEPGPAGVYWAEPFTKATCDEFALDFAQRRGVDISGDRFDIIYYDNTTYYSDHSTFCIIVDHNDRSYRYSDYRVEDRHDGWGTATEADLRAALDELGVPLPAAARFYDEGKGRYTFRAANLEQDGLFYDGSIECRVSKSSRLYEVDSAMAAVTLHGDAPVISQQEAYRRLCAGRFDHTNAFAFGFVDAIQGEVHVTACDLEYLTDSKGFRQPVYYFSLSDSNDETLRDGCSWRVFVPALA